MVGRSLDLSDCWMIFTDGNDGKDEKIDDMP